MTANIKKTTPIARAIKIVGTQVLLAKACKVCQPTVHHWLKTDIVSAEKVLLIEKATNGQVTRHELRPDLYPVDETENS